MTTTSTLFSVGNTKRLSRLKQELPLHLYLLPGIVLLILFSYIPMVGLSIAFQNFKVFKGWFAADFVGLKHFSYVMNLPNFWNVVRNTVYIALWKIALNMIVPIIIALMLNEMRGTRYKRTLQTAMYLPYFLSWVIFGGVISDMLASDGVVNVLLQRVGANPVNFMTDSNNFRTVLIVTEVWKNFGFNTIIYMAALTSIDLTQYEAAMIDGANRWQQTWHITLPGMLSVIIMLGTLSLGNVLNAGFEQVLVLYNKLVIDKADIIDTYVYRLGLEQAKYSVSTAVGLFKSIVSFFLITASYYLAYRFADYRIF